MITNYLGMPVWVFGPDWASDVTETLEWKTDVLASRSGAEQRRKLRLAPRRTIEFTTYAFGPDRAAFDNMLSREHRTDWQMPIWHDVHYVLADVISGASAVTVSDLALGEIVIGFGVLIRAPGLLLVKTVAGITGNVLTVDTPVAAAIPASAEVYALRQFRMTDKPEPDRKTDGFMTATVRFMQIGGMGSPVDTGLIGGGLDTYKGRSVFRDAPDESEALQYSYARATEELDNDRAIPFAREFQDYATMTISHSWLIEGKTNYDRMADMLTTMAGRYTPFWVPTFMEDFFLNADVGAGDSFFVTENVGFYASGGPRKNRDCVMFEMRDGSHIYRDIVSAVDLGETERINVSPAFPSAIATGDVVRVSFLTLGRLDQDSVEIKHATDTAGMTQVSLAVTTAPDLRQELAGF